MSLYGLDLCAPVAHNVEQQYAFTARLGFDLYSRGLANFFSEGSDSKYLGLCGPRLVPIAFFS